MTGRQWDNLLFIIASLYVNSRECGTKKVANGTQKNKTAVKTTLSSRVLLKSKDSVDTINKKF